MTMTAPPRLNQYDDDVEPVTSRRVVVLWSLIGLGLLVAACIAAFGIAKIVGQPSLQESREEAVAAAGPAIERIFTGPATSQSRVDRAGDVMTKRFRDSMLVPRGGGRGSVTPTSLVVVSREASAADCGARCSVGSVDVLVFADQATQNSAEPPASLRLMVRMVREGDQWRVDGIQNV